ncbi:AAA family ATPase [Eubacterium xylanophilum]|uniref:AAA family ATPase n=1 Tax=Eubacterium xylanophilum TaxID=39497 RepID=UPI00047EA456|nr:AAA family ATPase [Eubacterium xylanophilum]
MYNKLLALKQELNGKKAFLIEGARRIGKSTICEEFGKNEYKSYILIDFLISNNSKLKYKARIGECYVIHPRNLSFKEDIVCIPPYMTICL